MTSAALSEVAEFIVDGTHGSPERVDAGVPVLSAQHVANGVLSYDTDRFTTDSEYAAFDRRVGLKVNDVLLTIVGTIGRAAVVQDPRPAVFQRSVAIIRPKASRVDARYLYHSTHAPQFQAQLSRYSNQSAQAGIYLGKLSKVTLPVPPLDEQRRIAEILDKADALRQKRKRAIALLDSLVESVLDNAFGDEPTTMTLGDVFSIQGGLQLSASRQGLPIEAPYLRVANVHRDRLELTEIKAMGMTQAEFNRTALQAGDVLFVEGHGNADEIGRCAVWDGSIPGCSHQNHLIRARPMSDLVDSIVMSRWLNSPTGRKHLLRRGKTTSGLNTISVADVRSTPIPILSVGKKLGVRSQLDAFQAHKSIMRSQLSRLDVAFTSLQHLSFSGQL